MISVLGCPLEAAVRRLQAAGYRIGLAETRSRKGLEDGEDRVVRQQLLKDGSVGLTFARFQTEPNIDGDQDAGPRLRIL